MAGGKPPLAKSGSHSAESRTTQEGGVKPPEQTTEPASDTIIIHVCDEARKINRDFSCSRALLLSEMRYFNAYLTGSEAYDDIDISVHCDVHIFQWLMEHIKHPVCVRAPPSCFVALRSRGYFVLTAHRTRRRRWIRTP